MRDIEKYFNRNYIISLFYIYKYNEVTIELVVGVTGIQTSWLR